MAQSIFLIRLGGIVGSVGIGFILKKYRGCSRFARAALLGVLRAHLSASVGLGFRG